MITYSAFKSRPNQLLRLTGITHKEFLVILDKFKSSHDAWIRTKRYRPGRKRAFGAGRPARLVTLEDKLLFILVYVRLYPLLFLQGILFNLSESNACFWVHEYLPLLDEALGYAHARPSRPRGRNFEELIRDFPELIEMGILGDGTERPTRKPKNKDKRKTQYSGKKKRHTRKNVVLTRPDNQFILWLSDTVDGKDHDKKILQEQGPSPGRHKAPIPLGMDLGFAGLELPGFKNLLPTKKPKGKDLTSTQKSQNKSFSSLRIKVENAIGGAKRSRCVSDTYRNIKTEFDDTLMSVACGLHNIRVQHRYQTI